LLCARYVIYRCKYANRIPTIFEFRQMIKNVKFNELAIAQRNNKLEQKLELIIMIYIDMYYNY